MRSKESCFLNSPDWKELLSQQNPVWPFQRSQPRTMSLRFQLHRLLVNLPELLLQYSKLTKKTTMYDRVWEHDSDLVMHKADKIFSDVQRWLFVEFAPLLVPSHTPTKANDVQEQHIPYPDIVAGVLDCVAHTSLIALQKILRSCYRTRQNAPQGDCQNAISQLFEKDTVSTERWMQRAVTSFEFVKGESTLAAKPLAFGLRQIENVRPI